RRNRAVYAHGPARRSLQRSDRAVADGPVVCERRRAGERGHQGGRGWTYEVRPQELGEDLLRVGAGHPALVHLPPSVVGASDSGLGRPGWRDLRRGDGEPGAGSRTETLRYAGQSRTRSGRSRHLVLIGALAVFDARLARQDAGARTVLSDKR